jgi:tetratricopeptide (TPR) repeat protein
MSPCMHKALIRLLLLLLLSAPLSVSRAVAQAPEQEGAASAQEAPIQKGASDKTPYADAAVKAYNRGVELHQSGFLNQAIDEYKKAIQADERMEEAYSNLGVIYAAQRSFAKAQEAFTKALSLKPARPTTLNGLATVLYARGEIAQAKERWKQALAIDANFASAYYNIGTAQESEKDTKGALESYAHAIDVKPDMSDAYYRMGTIYDHQGHIAQARVLLLRAVAISPASEFVRDAKRQLSQIDARLVKESGRQLPAQKSEPESGSASAPGAQAPEAEAPRTEVPKATAAATKPKRTSSAADSPKKKFELFKHKTKPAEASKVNMFVKPKHESEEGSDLAPAPETTPQVPEE